MLNGPQNRRVCVVTGSRAEYGLLAPVMRKLAEAPDLDLRVCITGTHLEKAFGETWHEITADGFTINSRVPLDLSDDGGKATAQALGRGVSGFADAFDALAPDMIVILGDRYEILGAASAALLMRIPVLHIHGGEKTEGAIDESIRHAVTKLSSLHCVATEAFGQRIRQMGESPDTIHVVGTLALDSIAATPLIDSDALGRDLDLALDGTTMVVTYHPETADRTDIGVSPLLQALDRLPDRNVVVTLPNADPGHAAIREALVQWGNSNKQRARVVDSLGSKRYWSLLKSAGIVIGNSSSGLIEAPFFGIPTVNIGTRQQGRPRAPSVIDTVMETDAILEAVNRAESSAMKAIAGRCESPYGLAGAAARIVDIVRHANLNATRMKIFNDLQCND